MGKIISPIKNRIFEYLDYKGVTRSEFYEKTGLSASNFKGQAANSELGGEKIAKILAEFKDLNAKWLLTGSGYMIYERNKSPLENIFEDRDIIPLLPVEAMAGVLSSPNIQVMDYETEQYCIPMFRSAHFLIPVHGDSMYPTYNNGDVVACKRLENWTFFQFGRVYVVNTDQGILIKRVMQGSTSEHLLLCSDNKYYQPFEIHLEELLGVAIVIGGLWIE